jgi:hypothetical protein
VSKRFGFRPHITHVIVLTFKEIKHLSDYRTVGLSGRRTVGQSDCRTIGLSDYRSDLKKNSPLEVGNYRPISILSIVSKILERSGYKQLVEFLQESKILYHLQSGFRQKYSTDTYLIYLLDYLRTNNAKGLYTGMIMLDLQKAFDTVDHNILCSKLKVMGVQSVDWFESYLTDRVQFVSVNSTISEPMNVSCGVSQGSIMGSLLFFTYINKYRWRL